MAERSSRRSSSRRTGRSRPSRPKPRAARGPEKPAGRKRGLRFWLLLGLLLLVAAFAAYTFWFKGSSFVAVEDVQITGVEVSPSVASRLENTALGMSTLDLDREALEQVVADDPTVIGLKMETDFPHGLTIDVESRRAVGWWDVEGGTIVAADGVVLSDGMERPEDLPVIEAEPENDFSGDRVNGPALALAKILGGAPPPLLELSRRAWVDGESGPIVEVEGGIELRFGSPANPKAKWKAAAAVLADPKLTSARYLDLSVPSRPVVG